MIKELRTETGITQAKLAEILGCSQSMVARWEREECEPTESVIVGAAKAFGVTADALLGCDPQETTSYRYPPINYTRTVPQNCDVKLIMLIDKYLSAPDEIKKAVDKLLS